MDKGYTLLYGDKAEGKMRSLTREQVNMQLSQQVEVNVIDHIYGVVDEDNV